MTIPLKNALILMISLCTLISRSGACAPLGLGGGGCCAPPPPPPVTCSDCGNGCASGLQQCANSGVFLAAPPPPQPPPLLPQQYVYKANNDYRPIVSYATAQPAPPPLLPPPPPPSYIVPVQSSRSQAFLSQGNYYNSGMDPLSVGDNVFPTENRGMDVETSYTVGGLFPPQQEVTNVYAEEQHTYPPTPPTASSIGRTRKIVASYFVSTTPNGLAITSEDVEDASSTRYLTDSHTTTNPVGPSTVTPKLPLRPSGDSKTSSANINSKAAEDDNVAHSVKETMLTKYINDNHAANRGDTLSGSVGGTRYETNGVEKYVTGVGETSKISNYHHAESRYHGRYSTGHSSGERSDSEHRHFIDVDRHRSKTQKFYANSEEGSPDSERLATTIEPMLPTVYLASSIDNTDYDYGGIPLSSSSDTMEITAASRVYPNFSKTQSTMRQSSTTLAPTPSEKYSSMVSHQDPIRAGKLSTHELDLTTSGRSGKLLSNSKIQNSEDSKEFSHKSSSIPSPSHMFLTTPPSNPYHYEEESTYYKTAPSAPPLDAELIVNPYYSNSVETHSLIDQLQDESSVNNSSANANGLPIVTHEQYALHRARSAQIASVDAPSGEIEMKDEKWENPVSQRASISENLEYLAVVRDAVQERRIDPYIIYYNQNCQGIYLGRSVENSSIDAAEKCSRLGCAAINLRPIKNENGNPPNKVEVIFLKIAETRHFADAQNCMSVLNIPRHTRRSRPRNDGIGINRLFDGHGRKTVANQSMVQTGAAVSQRFLEVNPLRYSPKLLRDPSMQYRFATTMDDQKET